MLFVTALNALAEPANERWVEQEAKTKEFRFSLKFTNDGGSLVALRVINRKTDKVVQEVPIKDADLLPNDEQLLSLEDANFDGHQDIAIGVYAGGAGPNNLINFYLFNKKTKKFKFHEQLSSLTQVLVDSKNKTITSDFRGNCCDHSSETYRYIGGRLTLVENWREYLNSDHTKEITVTGKFHRGKMKYTTKEKPIDPNKL